LSDQNRDLTIEKFTATVKYQMERRLKMKPGAVTCVNSGGIPVKLAGNDLDSLCSQAQTLGAELVVFMLQAPRRDKYSEFKRLADRQYGLRSVCVAHPFELSDLNHKRINKYMTNVAQKINIKFGGFNASVDGVSGLIGQNTLVLGADVVHPGNLAFEHAPSIACIVGSVDHECGRFLGSARLQSKDKTDREVNGPRQKAWLQEV
jgi:eukaryotic translation initiation factor 2C